MAHALRPRRVSPVTLFAPGIGEPATGSTVKHEIKATRMSSIAFARAMVKFFSAVEKAYVDHESHILQLEADEDAKISK